ncbi:MAG: carboxymuconolactone decarboxylase family protein [Novosphingobium sp.]|nr:carboxymuconolactone decarboxylase family protein [Novosphingobium sp.]
MTRLAEIDPATLPDGLRSAFETADPRGKMMMTPTAHAPELMGALHHFADVLGDKGVIPARLVELLRLRIAFHNQCRSCMAMRYQSGIDDGITEGDVCSLETPEDAPNLSEADKAALAYADVSATNHFAINEETFARLRQHFSEPEIIELGLHIAYFVGFGRLVAAWDMVEELPEGYEDKSRLATPWDGGNFAVPNS